ncbi:Alpha/beta hydrolase fold-1 [Dillenia turbinata]|uniref:soluble epoxide hydrolase n=1 Tax=Dillenia turbinata TaxID=194707 RepID=A0AAN8Z837_9MAGN
MVDSIQHKTVSVNGINMHVADKGPEDGPIILFLHGFPGLWFTWRHQIIALSDLGYRTVAPDLRGYGDSDAPPSISSYTHFHAVGDLVALIDWLGAEKVFVVGHDMGALLAWYLCMFRPDRVKALVSLSTSFYPRNPKVKPVAGFRALYGDDFYIVRFQEPGEIETRFAEYGAERVLKSLYSRHSPKPLHLHKGKEFDDAPITLPSWMSQEDLKYYASKYEQKGFTGPLNYYRALDLDWELTAPWTKSQVQVPVKFMVGDMDLAYNMVGMKEYIHGGGFKKDVPALEEVVVMVGVAHFINEEKPEEVNKHIYDFFQKF